MSTTTIKILLNSHEIWTPLNAMVYMYTCYGNTSQIMSYWISVEFENQQSIGFVSWSNLCFLNLKFLKKVWVGQFWMLARNANCF